MSVSKKIVIELSENMAHADQTLPFCGSFDMNDDILPYPEAKLTGVDVDFGVTFVNPDVEVEGTVTCHVKGFCDRCLAPVDKDFVLPFLQTFYKDSGVEDDDYVYYDSKLDVTQAVRDEIVLGLPMGLLCKDDCKGLCPKCGANRNVTDCGCDTTRENPFSILKNIKF